MEYKNWSNVGPVKLIHITTRFDISCGKHGYVKTKVIKYYDSLEQFCNRISYNGYNTILRYYKDFLDNKFNTCIYKLVDECGLLVPYNIVEQEYNKTIRKRKNYSIWSCRWDYDHKKDFRNGPLKRKNYYKGNGTAKSWRGKGYGPNSYRYISNARDASAIEVDDEYKEYNIKIRKRTNIPNPWDNEVCTKYGNNWKRYRKTQWK